MSHFEPLTSGSSQTIPRVSLYWIECEIFHGIIPGIMPAYASFKEMQLLLEKRPVVFASPVSYFSLKIILVPSEFLQLVHIMKKEINL